MNKRCHMCGEVFPISFFNKNAARSDGYDCYCKDCRRAYGRTWYGNEPWYRNDTDHDIKETEKLRKAALNRFFYD